MPTFNLLFSDAVKALLIVALSLCIGEAILVAKGPAISNFPDVSIKAVASGGLDTLIIDARTRDKYAEGHIPGSVSLPLAEFETAFISQRESLQGKKIIVYCTSFFCSDSSELARELFSRGAKNVSVFKGGWEEWTIAGMPVAK